MNFEGITEADFDATAQQHVRSMIAKDAGTVCGTRATLRSCTATDVTLHIKQSRRGAAPKVSFSFSITVADVTAALTAVENLKREVAAATFVGRVRAQGGALASVTATKLMGASVSIDQADTAGSEEEGLSTGAIVGIAAGGVCLVLLLIAAGVYLYRATCMTPSVPFQKQQDTSTGNGEAQVQYPPDSATSDGRDLFGTCSPTSRASTTAGTPSGMHGKGLVMGARTSRLAALAALDADVESQ